MLVTKKLELSRGSQVRASELPAIIESRVISAMARKKHFLHPYDAEIRIRRAEPDGQIVSNELVLTRLYSLGPGLRSPADPFWSMIFMSEFHGIVLWRKIAEPVIPEGSTRIRAAEWGYVDFPLNRTTLNIPEAVARRVIDLSNNIIRVLDPAGR